MVKFELKTFKGQYDFVSQTSVYKTNLLVGDVEVECKNRPETGATSVEAKGNQWELGFSCGSLDAVTAKGGVIGPERRAGSTVPHLYGKKKWRLGKNNSFVLRQDIPNFNFAMLPSPEIQLENETTGFLGLDSNKLELKYHTFWKSASIEDAASFGGRFRVKGSMNSTTKLGGAKIALKTEVKHPYLEEFELSYSKSSAVSVACKLKPVSGSTLKAVLKPMGKSVSCEFEYDFKKDGLHIEVTSLMRNGEFSCPGIGIGFDF